MASEELQVVLELLRGIDLDDMTVTERRAATASVAQAPAGTHLAAADAGGVPAEWVTAGVADGRVVMYLHGGAYQLGSPATLRHLVALLSAAAQARAFSVDYRLAPEHPFPAAVDDAVAAYRWLLAAGHDPASIAIAGDSAGGGLTLATLVALRDSGDRLPAAAVAMSPWTDLALTGESLRTRADADVMITPAGMQQTATLYLAGADPRHPYASPLYADLHGLPPIPHPCRRRRGHPGRLDPVRHARSLGWGGCHSGDLGRDAACLPGIRRVAARGRPGGSSDRELAARTRAGHQLAARGSVLSPRRRCRSSAGVPPRHSRAAGLNGLRDLEDDAVPLCLVPGNSAVRDGPGEALPHAVQPILLTMRYPFST